MTFWKDIKFRKLLLLFLMAIAVLGLVYSIIDAESKIKDVNLISRGIDSEMKMFLNGYLGLFFGFHYSGNINWLVLPLIVYFLFTIKKRQRWEIALVLFYIISFVFIGVNGYFNSRYALTLIPITIGLLFIGLNDVMGNYGFIRYKKFILLFVLLLVAFNNVHYTFSKGDSARQEVKSNSAFAEYWRATNEKIALLKQLPNSSKGYLMMFFGANLLIGDAAYKIDYYLFWYMYSFAHEIGYKILIDRSKPDVILDYLNSMQVGDKKYLVNNIPVFYYYTNKKGVYYWCGDDVYFGSNGKNNLLKNRTFEETSSFLKDSLNCPFIFSYKPYNDYYPKFKEYLNVNCDSIFVDVRGDYILYKIK